MNMKILLLALLIFIIPTTALTKTMTAGYSAYWERQLHEIGIDTTIKCQPVITEKDITYNIYIIVLGTKEKMEVPIILIYLSVVGAETGINYPTIFTKINVAVKGKCYEAAIKDLVPCAAYVKAKKKVELVECSLAQWREVK